MKLRTAVGVIAGTGLLFGASLVFAQQQTGPSSPAQTQNCPMPSGAMMNNMGSHMGMSGMAGGHTMNGAIDRQSGMHAILQKLQTAIEQAKTATDPAKVKSALDEAEADISQLMSHMGGMGMMNGSGMMMHHSGAGQLMGQSPSAKPQQ